MKKYMKNQLTATILSSALLLTSLTPTYAQTTHTVQSGEYLLGIASQYGISLDQLMSANGLSSDWLMPGTVLTIPSGSSEGESQSGTASGSGIYTVQPGDTLIGIANAYGISVAQLMSWNGLSSSWIYAGTQLSVSGPVSSGSSHTTAPAASGNYVIQPGDTLSGIAAANGITVHELMAANNLQSDWLIAGMPLYVPGGAVAPSSPVQEWQPAPTANATNGIHTVQPGDTLSGIAAAYGVTVTDLYNWNGLSSDWLNVGDRLSVIPTQGPVNTPSSETSSQGATEATANGETQPASNHNPNASAKRENGIAGPEKSNLRVNGMRVADLPVRARPAIHVVQAEDTVESIAEQYELRPTQLRRWNRLKTDTVLTEGQELFVSNPALVPQIHQVEEGESLYDIAVKYNTTEQWIMLWNELTQNVAPETDKLLIVSNPNPLIHEVVPGETLQDIADKYDITLEELKTWNKIPAEVEIVNGVVIVSNPQVGDPAELEGNHAEADSEVETEVEETEAADAE